MNQDHIRNFCIIAHIDHGKSTLADRLLEITHTVDKREMKQQLLDQMDLEREKGITIKLQPVRMAYVTGDGRQEAEDSENSDSRLPSPASSSAEYQLNLIDTPGHVDFGYEVSRSLQACEGALLVVDATQGVQAQTLANVYLAIEAELKIIPIINKIDLPAANIDKVSREITQILGCQKSDIVAISAKTGENVASVLEAIIKTIPAPRGNADGPLRGLVFDSLYDEYRGVILSVRIVDGSISKSDSITMLATNARGKAMELGYLTPKQNQTDVLNTGEIGYVVSDFKTVADSRVGDTVTGSEQPAGTSLPGYKTVLPFVYAGMFPASSDDYPKLKEALERLALNDASLQFTAENSHVLGFGFRVGCLGLLHMDIVRERLERDNDLELIVTNPSTEYKVRLSDGSDLSIKNAADLPDAGRIAEIKEPWISGEIVCPKQYVGPVLQLLINLRGQQKKIGYPDDQLAVIDFEAPLANMLTDFYDQLKSITSGYGSFNYELGGYRPNDLVRLDFLVATERVDSLSTIVHRSEVDSLARSTVIKLKEVIPKQLFQVSLQAAIGGKIIARENVSALKKNVTGHLYGGDVSRKKKLWAKQKAGKKRMKKIGKVDIPSEVFTVMLRKD